MSDRPILMALDADFREVGLIRSRRRLSEVDTMPNLSEQEAPRRSFTDEFRAGAVRMVLDEGRRSRR